MRITGIKFLNLNSLKGHHEIRFDKAPFTQSGIFAITGPTGAGKTTLLDAITVALYGRVHRHSKDVFEIMTRHTAESYAEVEFEVAEQSYRAKWSIRRSRGKADGQLQTQKMELSEVATGKIIIEHPLNEVREEIVRICGLDYNQFLRSVILSQGDFTRFLKADENERSELLERITDTGIYSEISIAAFEKARDERYKLEQLKGRLENVVLLTAEEHTIYTTELAALSTRETLLKEQETVIRAGLNWLELINRLSIKQQQQADELSVAELFHSSQEPTFVKLRKHQDAVVYRPALAELDTIERQLQRIISEIKEAELLYPDIFQAEKTTNDALTGSKLLLATKEKALIEKEPVFELVSKKDILIEQAKNQFGTAVSNLETAQLNLKHTIYLQEQLNEQLAGVRQRIAQLSGWLADNPSDATLDNKVILFEQILQHLSALKTKSEARAEELAKINKLQLESQSLLEDTTLHINSTEAQLADSLMGIQQQTEQLTALLSGRTTDQLEEELREFPVLIYTVEQQFKLANSYADLMQEQGLFKQKYAQLQEDEQKATITLNQLKIEVELGSEQLNNLQQIYELEARVQKYDADRLQLQRDQPCPLCGAVHHPFVEGSYVSKMTEAEERRNQQQLKLQEFKKQLESQQAHISNLSYQLESTDKNLSQTAESVAQVQSEFVMNNEKLPKALDILKPDIIAAVRERKKLQQDTLKEHIAAVRLQQQQLITLENQLNSQKEKLSQEKNKAEQSKLQLTFAAQQLEAVQNERNTFAEEIQTLERHAISLLEPLGLKFSWESTKEIISELNRRYQYYHSSAQELKASELDLRQQETELKNLVKTSIERTEAVDQLKLQTAGEAQVMKQLQEERHLLFGIEDPILERAKLSDELRALRVQTEEFQQQLQQKQEKLKIIEDRQLNLQTSSESTSKLYDTLLKKLLEKLKTDGINAIADLKGMFLSDDEAKQLTIMQQDSFQRISSGKSLLKATETELKTATQKSLTEETTEQLLPRLEEVVGQVSTLHQEKGKLNQVLAEDEALRLKHTEVAGQIESQQQEFDRFQKLSALIGSADGKKFSRFAQGLTLARLTELANRHLLRLSDRYSILKSPEKDLDLQIIDGYQADVVRPMSTLSGGESFLVSLALALGLSDLASRKVQINSLFIDEGFGTLDAETLDVAITALENLQASGKNIGIISHVEALKERIGTQIQLSREPGGTSKISIFNYGNNWSDQVSKSV